MNTSFYDPAQFAWTNILKSHYPEIKQEWESSPVHLRLARAEYHYGKTLEKNNSKWDLLMLMNRDKVQEHLRVFFPVTMSLIDKLPIFENLSFSVFYPRSETIPHKGWSTKILRVHLAIDTNSDAALCCGDRCVSLKNGEILIFEDGKEHYAYNRSHKERTVLLFDVLKSDLDL